ncbi:hypothetical protein FRC03_011042 [Tulasnella sp. 419]|nr:hypothetical protein FRC03_011042 [Tulasnella sp. 419]
MGLSNSSIGWAMLERFISEPNLGDWDHAWSLITSGKATLLLPLEQLSGNLDVSDEFIRDHVAFCNGPSTSASPLFTLSGLRGSIEGEKVTFRSTISTSSTLHATLVNPVTRPTALTSTPPLPHPLTPVVNPPYPTFSLPNHTSSLPCPPRSALIPPPLPARPNPNRAQATTSSTSSSQSTSRLNPFASLFGRTATPDPPQASSQTTPVHSPSPSIEANVKHEHLTLSVFTIDHSIRKKEVIKDISRAMKGQVKEILGSSGMGLPSWIVSRVVDFLNAFYKKQGIPIPSEDSSSGQGHSPTRDNNISRSSTSASLKSRLSQEFDIDFSSAAAIAESIQVFFGSLEDEMRHYWGATGSAFIGTRKAATQQKGDAETASLNDETSSLSGAEKKAEEKEQKLRDTMDAVERIICGLFYDKLFAPEGSDDRNHDEAVAGRVAALNMLDLDLSHLGVEIPDEGVEGVEEVIKDVGKELSKLENVNCRAPGEKTAVLVTAHKIVVDGLSKLPPVKLRPEGEPVDNSKPPVVAHFPDDQLPEDKSAKPMDGLDNKDKPVAAEPTSAQKVLAVAELVASPAASPEMETASLQPDADSTTEIVATDAEKPQPSAILPTESAKAPDPAPLKPPVEPTPVSSDILLPLIIYAVVKSNPHQLVSHLLYAQRYRHRSAAGGEEGYCLVNMLAVAEFLENVDMEALGLTEADRVSIAELDPIPIHADATALAQPSLNEGNLSSRLRGKVNQQVGELAGSANKVISGVVDSSFSALRGLLSSDQAQASAATSTGEGEVKSPRQGFGLLRRGSGFSIASMAASLPGGIGKDMRLRAGSVGTNYNPDIEGGQQLLEVPPSRAASIRSAGGAPLSDMESSEQESDSQEESAEESDDESLAAPRSDARSIRSFGSMMSKGSRDTRPRKSLTDRLANVSARISSGPSNPGPRTETLRKTSPPSSRPGSLLSSPSRLHPQILAEPPSATIQRIAPPNPRFMECTADDLRMSEIPELLKEYRRVVEALRANGGFNDYET